MSKNWSTKEKDLQMAAQIIEEYARRHNYESLSLVELVVDEKAKQMGFQMSHWVLIMAAHFHALYGFEQGDLITRQVISNYITQGQTMH